METTIAYVKNYKPTYLEEYKTYASVSSFRLEMRNVLKNRFPEIYFSKSPIEDAKNMGCYLFGQPDKWKGVVGIRINGNNVTVVTDYRNILDKDTLKDIFDKILGYLKNEDIIEDYIIVAE